MGIALVRNNARIQFDYGDWRRALALAQVFGWRPMGTNPPEWMFPGKGMSQEDEAECGATWQSDNYTTSDGQAVCDEDARNLGAAVEAALGDIPRHRAREGGYGWPRPDADVGKENLVEHFSGPTGRTHLRLLADFCKVGAFVLL
jgi:hypothetical protein